MEEENSREEEEEERGSEDSMDLVTLHIQAEATFTPEPLEDLKKEETVKKEETSSEDKTFCCKKHSKVFSQERTSIRMCATKQLYEQVSCDEPYVEEKTVSANQEKKGEVVPQENELNAHEADIRGKLLNKRRSMNPSKVKEVTMLETAEDDIEEIPHLPGLPNVVRRDDAEMMGGKKSAFTESSSLSSIETEEEEASSLELGGDLPLSQRPPSSRSRPPSASPLFCQGKGRPSSSATTRSTRPSSSSSLASSTEGREAAIDTDSGVEVNPSPVKESLPRLPPVKSKDEMLQQLQSGRRQLDKKDCKLEDWE